MRLKDQTATAQELYDRMLALYDRINLSVSVAKGDSEPVWAASYRIVSLRTARPWQRDVACSERLTLFNAMKVDLRIGAGSIAWRGGLCEASRNRFANRGATTGQEHAAITLRGQCCPSRGLRIGKIS